MQLSFIISNNVNVRIINIMYSFINSFYMGRDSNNYIKIPMSNGDKDPFIIQWGFNANSGIVTFPISFKKVVFSVQCTLDSNGTPLGTTGSRNITLSNFFLWFRSYGGGDTSNGTFWIAFGT